MERPILMSAPMVRAILDGRKSQTRRTVKPRKDMGFGCPLAPNELAGEINNGDYTNSKYGRPGDRLWVRESFQPLMADGIPESEWQSCNYKTGEGYKVSYVATDGIVEYYDIADDNAFCNRITPSIFMPRWASRITLEITGIHAERLQDISEADCIAEGCEHPGPIGPTFMQQVYKRVWTTINGAASWDANPWVWVVTFNRVTTPRAADEER